MQLFKSYIKILFAIFNLDLNLNILQLKYSSIYIIK